MRRLRLHLLYIVNDILHWTMFHSKHALVENTATTMLPAIRQIVCLSAARVRSPQHRQTMASLLDIWDKNKYFSSSDLADLKTLFQEACEKGEVAIQDLKTADNTPSQSKDVPWDMPATHGDPLTPYYDLPAANMMPLISPNSSMPIETHRMKAIQLTKGPADPALIAAVQDFLKEANQIYNMQDEVGAIVDIDAMGQAIILDEMGDRIGGETYYGWSRAFCEKVKKRGSNIGDTNGRGGRPRSRSNSMSDSDQSHRSKSRLARKRRRSLSRSRSRSRSRTRRRSRYSSSRSRSRSRARRSASPLPMVSQSHMAQQTPVHPSQPSFNQPLQPHWHGHQSIHAPPQTMYTGFQMNIPIPPPPLGIPLMQNGFPIPPPRPAGWTGPWPPPPPPSLPMSGAPLNNIEFPPSIAHPLPPPPPPTMSGHWPPSGGRDNRTQDPRRR